MRTRTKTNNFFAPRATVLGGAVWRVAMTMLLCLMLPKCMQTALAQESYGTEGDWEYTYAAGVVTLTGYTGSATVVTTPTTLGGNTVSKISGNCFRGNTSLTGVTVSEGVVEIYDNYSFADCTQLESISLPSTLSILGKLAFYNCSSLKAIVLPSGMTHINDYTFAKCSSLETVSIPSSVRAIGECAFAECYALTSVTLPAGVTEIEEYAFLNCWDLATVNIQGNVTRIGKGAFSGCYNALTSITIPGSVTEIGEGAFRLCYKLANVYFDGSKAQWNAVTKGNDWNSDVPSDFQEHWRCTLTYDMQGHGTAPAAQTVYSGTANVLTAPTAPTAQGYDFGGWYGDAACTEAFDFTAALDDNVTVYAKWTALANTIQFDLDGRGSAISNQTVYSGNTVTEPNVQFDGTDGIEGWYTDAGRTLKYDFTTVVDHSFTLYARWAAAGTATITTNGEGGTATLTNAKGQTFNDGKVMPGTYTLTVTPASGYSFSGSYTLTDRSSGASLQPTSISGGTAHTYTLDLTENDVAVSVTFSTQPIVTISTTTDGTASAGSYTLADGAGHDYTTGGTLLKVSDGTEWNINYDLTLTVTPNTNTGCAISIVNNGVTTYLNDGTTSYTFTPRGNIDIRLHYFVRDVEDVTLADNADNSTTLASLPQGEPLTVQLSGRTLYKDGAWNTLCLPFDLHSLTGTPLEGATVMRLNVTSKSSGVYRTRFDESDGTLNLYFSSVTGNLEAGVPYIVKWETTGTDISAPVFNGVFITATTPQTVASNDGKVAFTDTYAPKVIGDGGDNTVLYLGSGNTLYYPNAAMAIGCHRAYFQLLGGLTAGEPVSGIRSFALHFGTGEASGIGLTPSPSPNGEGSIYTLNGVKLDGQPTRKGLYIVNGHKVVVK